MWAAAACTGWGGPQVHGPVGVRVVGLRPRRPGAPPAAGEHMDQFEHFDAKRFVERLLGRGDVAGLMDKIHDVIPEDKQPEIIESFQKVRRSHGGGRAVWEAPLRSYAQQAHAAGGAAGGRRSQRVRCESGWAGAAVAAARLRACL